MEKQITRKRPAHQESLETRVLIFIREHDLLSGQGCLLVGVSGGQDSVCLLHVLAGLQKELKITLHVAHLNHQMRGVDSEADARYVSRLADHLGIPATVASCDVKAHQARRRLSSEEAAREVRYDFLARVAKSIGADRVAVGHTTDDNMETILLHLIRGTGTRGLRGLQPVGQWKSAEGSLTVIRPLLPVSRQETADYCRDHRLTPVVDATNLSLSPLRNRIRHQLWPLLQSYNPRVSAALLRAARIAADDLAFLDGESARWWGQMVTRQGDTMVLDKEAFLKLASALQRHLMRRAIEELLGSLKDVEARHIEEIMAALDKPAGRSLNLPGGLVFTIEYNRYLLGREPGALSPYPVLPDEYVLKIPGKTLLSGWRVEATIIEHEPAEEADNLTAYFNRDKVGHKIVVRSRRPADRFQPLGMNQAKKLGEFMIDAKIPRAWRQRVPVVSSPEHILWVVGWRIDDRVKVTENTRSVLCLKFERRQG